ncbi:MAG: DUF4286 family protein [Chitinophagales bacterium]|nr:DUF4286 family protein [Chitinophagales bacterium]HMV15922.1 DUF4286 family protein [Chitinophagales bacterium]HMX61048.1 DUF4286 family protein [Chitinophagales bacterium]HMY24343.1 DUF4286 family protein [Chitinophagales bacterium]HMZ34799.1 DUF4286 family protein [Chitinophagales bacterium]
MIVYTLTANVDEDIADEWLQWMKNEVLHFALGTQLPVEFKSFKVLNDNEGVTYTFQLFFKDVFVYKLFLTEHHADFSKLINAKYTDKAVYFNTLLQQL